MTPKSASANELDRMFDDGEDMSDYVDWSSARRPGREQPVAFELPPPMLSRLDATSRAQGVTRQALVEKWLAERLDQAA